MLHYFVAISLGLLKIFNDRVEEVFEKWTGRKEKYNILLEETGYHACIQFYTYYSDYKFCENIFWYVETVNYLNKNYYYYCFCCFHYHTARVIICMTSGYMYFYANQTVSCDIWQQRRLPARPLTSLLQHLVTRARR